MADMPHMPHMPHMPEMPVASQQTAIVAKHRGCLAICSDVQIPSLRPDMVLVKTAAVAINQVDAKMLDHGSGIGAVYGHDFAGTIVALGSEAAAAGRLALGDRVAGLVYGGSLQHPDVGAFAEYVGAYADLLLKLPGHMKFEEAAGLGVGIAAACLALFSDAHLGIPESSLALKTPVGSKTLPGDDFGNRKPGEFVLVAGGSTASGTRAIQLLKLAGLRPIATCSPSNYNLTLRFGAEKTFDYHSPSCAADIRAYTQNELALVLDCISQTDTTEMCYSAMGRAGGRYVALEPYSKVVAQTRPLTIEPSWVMALSIFGHAVHLDGEYSRESQPQDRRLGERGFAAIQHLLDRGLIEAHPVRVIPGGWPAVVEGVDRIRKETASGYKLVYPVL